MSAACRSTRLRCLHQPSSALTFGMLTCSVCNAGRVTALSAAPLVSERHSHTRPHQHHTTKIQRRSTDSRHTAPSQGCGQIRRLSLIFVLHLLVARHLDELPPHVQLHFKHFSKTTCFLTRASTPTQSALSEATNTYTHSHRSGRPRALKGSHYRTSRGTARHPTSRCPTPRSQSAPGRARPRS